MQVALNYMALPCCGGNGQSIGSAVSDAIVGTGCGPLQPGIAQWATLVALLELVDN